MGDPVVDNENNHLPANGDVGDIHANTNGDIHNGHHAGDEPSPPPPRNLQDVLRMAVAAAAAGGVDSNSDESPESSTYQNGDSGELNGERRQFLEDALNAFATDTVEVLSQNISLIRTKLQEEERDPNTDADIVAAMEVLLDYVADLDVANDFHKIGGYELFEMCFDDDCSAEIKAVACKLLAELSQNNPYCQQVSIEMHLISKLLDLIEADLSEECTSNAVYALSCIVRNNPNAVSQFITYLGPQILLVALELNRNNLITKICFFLLALCTTQFEFARRLVEMGYLSILIKLLLTDGKWKPCFEHILQLIESLLVVQDDESNDELRRSITEQYDQTMKNLVNELQGGEDGDFENELRILNLLRDDVP